MGYSPKRRAELHVIGANFVKQCVGRETYYCKKLGYDKKALDETERAKLKELLAEQETEAEWKERRAMTYKKSFYGALYMDRKKKEREKRPFNPTDPDTSDAHINALAMRWVEKRFLRDLWNRWRGLHGEGPATHDSKDRW